MLSVIVYGRNDSHTAGLQKRAALSLNCLATLLGPDDEILFVDYNTPDGRVTFPEAIADTLTDAARERLRILRVRPRHHARLQALTRRSVIESLARNVGLRRAAPSSRWVLSTNTDVVVLPRAGTGSLAGLCRELGGGCWHLPRFELPEFLWQDLRRDRPAEAMAAIGGLAEALHLKEMVRGSQPAVFDNHGDFQLIERAVLEAVHGFDERMLHGWAVDSNLAKRLLLRLGRIGRLDAHLELYHCAHHREPSDLHQATRVEDDYQRFYSDLDRPDLPHQAAGWGLAGEEIEDFRIAAGRFGRAVAAALPPAAQPGEAVYSPDDADLPHYPATHVAVHALDLLAAYRRDTVLAWSGARPATFQAFAAGWRALGFSQPIIRGGRGDDAEVLVFEFGCASQDEDALTPSEAGAWSDDDLIRLAPVAAAFDAAVAEERRRLAAGRPPRLFVTINANHNRCEPLVASALAAARVPFTTRLRHGHVAAPRARPPSLAPAEAAHWVARAIGRRRDLPITEAVRLLSHLERLLADAAREDHAAAALTNAAGLLALIDHPAVTARWPQDRRLRLRGWLAQERGAARLPGRITVPVAGDVPPPDAAPSRLVQIEDWDDAGFLDWARRLFGPFAGNRFRLSAEMWSAAHAMRQMERLGVLEGRLLAVTAGAHPLPDALSRHAGSLDAVCGGIMASRRLRDPSRMTLCRNPPDGPYDAAVVIGRPDATADAAVRLRHGGILIVLAPVDLARPITPPRLDGCRLLPQAPAISERTLDHVGTGEDDGIHPPLLRLRSDGAVTCPAAWVFMSGE